MPEEATKKVEKKRRFATNVRIGGDGMDTQALRALAQKNPETFMQRVNVLIDNGELTWSKVRSLPRLFKALSDVQVRTEVDIIGGAVPVTRAIQASAFPLLAGGLTVAGVNAAYEAVPTIAQDLVTEMEDNKRVTVITSITSMNPDIDNVPEGEDFPEIGAGEETFTIGHKPNGRRISITAPMIEENDVVGIVSKVNALGEIANETIEELSLRRICDIDGSGTSPAEPYALHLGNVGTQLYNNTDDNPTARCPNGTRVHNNSLTDETDLETVRAVLASMLNHRLKRISIPMSQCILLVPDALVGVARKIRGSENVSGVINELSNWGTRGAYQPTIVSSPKLDDLSTSVWYLGNFRKQFTRKWKLRFEYVSLTGNTESFLRSRLAFQARLAWDVEVGVSDFVWVVQSLSGTTAP